jgi:hypothetical protein
MSIEKRYVTFKSGETFAAARLFLPQPLRRAPACLATAQRVPKIGEQALASGHRLFRTHSSGRLNLGTFLRTAEPWKET